MLSAIQSLLFGVAVGDALGVPVEFKSRQQIALRPVTDMIGFGTYNLPPGTFSDDSSLTFCLAEALTQDFDLHVIARNFVRWYRDNYWTARGVVFDIGIATREAIERMAEGIPPELAGGSDITSNGNGSLMRISPLLFYTRQLPEAQRFDITRQVSSLTHRHIRSVVACHYYLEFARLLLEGSDKFDIYHHLQKELPGFLAAQSVQASEIAIFDRLFRGNIHELPEPAISSSGYVLHTLEASIWCLLRGDSFREATLAAVNLGEDSDTTGAVTGGLAGLLYGLDGIPQEWIEGMARKEDIADLGVRMAGSRVAARAD